MSPTKKLLLFVLLTIIGFALYTFISTGFFRSVENDFNGQTVLEIPIKGAEDITISAADSFAIVSATARLAFPPSEQEHGGLYYMELKSGNFVLTHLTPDFGKDFAPHGISMFKRDSVYTIAVVNHMMDEHSIEIFTLVGKKLTHIRTEKSTKLVSPNDVVLLDENRFYVTNDHGNAHGFGRLLEDYGNWAASNVLYFDGQQFTEAAEGISFANGINFDPKRNLVFVASPRRFLIKVYAKADDNSLSFVEDIPCGTGVDNIEFDNEGNLWVGCHPNLLRFTAYATGKKETSPSEVLKIAYRGKGDYTVESMYTNDGSQVSATSVAAPFGNLLFVGNVKDDEMLILKRDN
ncbi:MAG: SMP-30/gluconolactonase/LRE family protein [Flavobacteriales bacterium]|nr:SMP-30/gluconolactonase/LRE family protein [Flavobacteriales bacterium]